MAGLLDYIQGASNSAASGVSIPVDALAWALRKAGVPVGDAPPGSSDWMAQQGLTKPVPQSAQVAGDIATGLLGFGAAAKAGTVAKGLLTASEFSPRQAYYGAKVGEWTPTRAADWEVAGKLRDRIAKDFDGYAKRYGGLLDAEGGKVLNVDTARELSPYYLADRSRAAAVHEPASDFIKDLYARKLGAAPGPGEAPMVMFTAGGTGAGKSTAIKAVPGAKLAKDAAQIVYDTNMSTYESAVKKIDQALAAGKQVRVSMVVRDPVDALVNGALPRAERQRAQFGSGRTVPIGEHAKTHIGAVDAVPRLSQHYADNPNVFFEALDNTKGKGNVTPFSVDKLGEIKYDGLERLLRDALEKEYDMGRISAATYKGFLSGQ